MAEVTTTRVLPPEFVEAAGKTYLSNLAEATGGYKTADLSKAFGDQFVAGQDRLQKEAQKLAEAGIGGYQKFLDAAAASTGPTGYKQFMSPYQQDVIDTTLAEYDVQAQKGIPSIAAQAIGAGAFGGGREGVQRAVYQGESDRNRAALQAQLLQQGFTQANQLANQAFGQQMALGQNQQGLAAQVPGLYGQDISTLGSAGAIQQAQEQAGLDATRERNRLRAYEPYERLGFQQTGVASIASGAPGQYQSMVTPNPTPLQNALGIAGVAGGLMTGYGDFLRGRNTT